MDHVSANKTLSVTERENISGARVFDGEDQGKFQIQLLMSFLLSMIFDANLLIFYRCRKQIQNATVTAERLV